jgi:hypothetical protein
MVTQHPRRKFLVDYNNVEKQSTLKPYEPSRFNLVYGVLVLGAMVTFFILSVLIECACVQFPACYSA